MIASHVFFVETMVRRSVVETESNFDAIADFDVDKVVEIAPVFWREQCNVKILFLKILDDMF